MTSFDTLETLDDRAADPATASASLRDIVVINRLFGGRHAVRWGVTRLLTGIPRDRPVTLLDLGAGAGDIADDLRRHLPWRVTPLAFDHLHCAATMSRARGVPAVVADLHAIPLPPRSVDVVIVSQVLHHLPRGAVPAFLRNVSTFARI
ncbi:MAG: class I SAM-dependent methyltransferase, partial [Gemmatimonadales bacterium]